jgi:hypothetical protein
MAMISQYKKITVRLNDGWILSILILNPSWWPLCINREIILSGEKYVLDMADNEHREIII